MLSRLLLSVTPVLIMFWLTAGSVQAGADECPTSLLIPGSEVHFSGANLYSVTDHHLNVVDECLSISAIPMPFPILQIAEPPLPSIVRITSHKQDDHVAIRVQVNSQSKDTVLIQTANNPLLTLKRQESLPLIAAGKVFSASFTMERNQDGVRLGDILVQPTD